MGKALSGELSCPCDRSCLGRFKFKITLEGHINKFVQAITPTFIHGFQNNYAHVFSLRSSSAI